MRWVIPAREVIDAFVSDKAGFKSPAHVRRGGRRQLETVKRPLVGTHADVYRVGLLAYGHWPLALHIGAGRMALNASGVSNTTSRHRCWAERAARSHMFSIVRVPDKVMRELWCDPAAPVILQERLSDDEVLDRAESVLRSARERKLLEAVRLYKEKRKIRKVVRLCK